MRIMTVSEFKPRFSEALDAVRDGVHAADARAVATKIRMAQTAADPIQLQRNLNP